MVNLILRSCRFPRFAFAAALSLAQFAFADITMPAIFGDHMVLQQDAKLPIWGWADPGEKVTVTLGADSLQANAAADGAWRVDFPPRARVTGDAAQSLTITGHNAIRFQDVLIGDVWIASGQSNMAYGITKDVHGDEAVATADQPKIRIFYVPEITALDPLRGDKIEARWVVCTPETLKITGRAVGFSAVAYYFAREIAHVTGHPIGIVGSYWGGTPAEAWTSISGLVKEPALASYVQNHARIAAAYPAAVDGYAKAKADFDVANKSWYETYGKDYYKQTGDWAAASADAAADDQAALTKPRLTHPKPIPPIPPDGGQKAPGNLFNGMVAPLIPYAIKGAIWYQGEANTGRADSPLYGILFSRLITDWREKWGQGDFPFLFVQIANISSPAKAPSETTGSIRVREGQLKALALPATGMAVTIDIGNPYNIHPADKLDVGKRLALAARHVAYGEDLVYSGPIYQAMKVEGAKIRLSFTQTGGGLIMGIPPWTPSGKPPATPGKLTGFAIAGADLKWYWADADIEGQTIIVSSEKVASPVAVRYGWASCPPCNLYNREGLPASPFRTDSWEELPARQGE